MADSTQLELFRMMHDSRQKYVYFLLAGVGACVGFAVTQTKHACINTAMIPLAIAILSWAASFYFGCRFLNKRSVMLGTNIELYKIQVGTNPVVGRNPESIAYSAKILDDDFNTTNNQAGFAYRWQFRLFVFGSIAFLAWHILEMWQRTNIT